MASGTSFSTPIVGGIAALVRQQQAAKTQPAGVTFSALDVKSALVNTATNDISDPEAGTDPASVLDVGGGKADALAAINTNVTVEPATLSFGVLAPAFTGATQTLTLRNFGTGTVNLILAMSRRTPDTATQMSVNPTSLSIAAAKSATVAVTLSGTRPPPGAYEGALQITGGTVPLHVPYLYLVGDGRPANLIALSGSGDVGTVGEYIPSYFAFLKLVDQYGVPVSGASVTWTAQGGGSFDYTESLTDQFGIAAAVPVLGTSDSATYRYVASIPGFTTYTFLDFARLKPTINPGGVVNSASFSAGNGIAPGSYISLFGTGLAESTAGASTVPLPIAIDFVSVGFDGTGLKVPASMYYVSPTQVNVQVPWELAGQADVQMKVNVDFSSGNLVTVPVTTYSPAVFSYSDATAGQIAAALDSTYQIIGSSHPAQRGQFVQLYCNGLGPVTNQPASGAAALGEPLSLTQATPTVTIGGQGATVQFSGLAPGYSGLYQLNVEVPSSISAGVQPIALSIGGVAAPVVNLPVQ